MGKFSKVLEKAGLDNVDGNDLLLEEETPWVASLAEEKGQHKKTAERIIGNTVYVPAIKKENLSVQPKKNSEYDPVPETVSSERLADSAGFISEKRSYRKDWWNDTEKDEESGEQFFKKPVSSSQQRIKQKEKTLKKSGGQWDARFYMANYENHLVPEIFKTLRSRILLAMENQTSAGTIMVTSAMPGEGKSFIAANLALAFASGMDQFALLVDGDLRKPAVKKLFGCTEDFGLVNYLRDEVPLPDLLVRSELPKLSLLLAGKVPANPAELLSSERMVKLVEELSARYEDRTIIFDTPPTMIAAETRVLANHVNGVILVVRQGISGKARIEETINAVGKEKIIGIVFNDHTGNYFNKSSRYGYGYGYEYEYGKN